jgi:hypothetical protein
MTKNENNNFSFHFLLCNILVVSIVVDLDSVLDLILSEKIECYWV